MATAAPINVADDTSWRSRLTSWFTGRGKATSSTKQAVRRIQHQVPQGAISEADRERILLIEAPQYVFGEGRNSPGSAAFYEQLMAPLKPGPDRSMLVLGAGLGFSARALHRSFGGRVSGLDPVAGVVEKAVELTEAEGLSEQVKLRTFNPELAKLPERAFDCVLVEPLMFALQNKVELLREIDLTLKNNGQMILLDFVVGKLHENHKNEWRGWLDSEKPAPKVRTTGEQKDLFEKAKLKVRQSTDITQPYAQMVTRTWARCLDRLEGKPRAELQTDPTLRGVAELAEYWGRRAMLMEVGALKLRRYHVTKAKFGG